MTRIPYAIEYDVSDLASLGPIQAEVDQGEENFYFVVLADGHRGFVKLG